MNPPAQPQFTHHPPDRHMRLFAAPAHSAVPAVKWPGRFSREDPAVEPDSSLGEATRAALTHSQIIDLTTTGRRSGQPRRIEIFLHHDEDQLFITGMPRADRTRDWIYNVEADPHVVIHLKQ